MRQFLPIEWAGQHKTQNHALLSLDLEWVYACLESVTIKCSNCINHWNPKTQLQSWIDHDKIWLQNVQIESLGRFCIQFTLLCTDTYRHNSDLKALTSAMILHTWKVDCMTYTFGYILRRSCWPSLVRMCWTIRSIATWLSPPRGKMTSAYFFVGNTKSSNAGFTNFAYCT